MATAKKAPAKKAPAKKAAPAKKVAAKKAPAKKVVAKKAPAKKAAPAKKVVAKKAPAKKAAVKKAPAKKVVANTITTISPAGTTPLPRTEVVSKLWAYIKKNKLQDAVNKRMINADAKLKEVFNKAQVSMFEMAGLIGKHLK